MDTTQLVRQNFLPEYPALSRGHIAGVVELVAGKPKQKASVTAFTDLLLVLLPNASSEALYGPCKWGAIHGTQFPAVGAEVQVGVDETNHPVVLWWAGEQKEPAAIKTLEEKVKELEERKNFKLSAPEAQTSREVNKEFEPSATKDALVLLQINSKPAEVETTLSLKVGGVQVGTVIFPKLTEASVQTVTIAVPAAKKWEVKVTAGAVTALNSSYTFLD